MPAIDANNNIIDEYGYTESKTTVGSADLNKDAFLQLLVTEMEYQDPLEPTSNTEYIAQLAEFSALEQMQNLNRTEQMKQATDMIGKVVEAQVLEPETGQYTDVKGVVDGVTMEGSSVFLTVDGEAVALSDVTSISEVDYDAETVLSLKEINKTLESIQNRLDKLDKSAETDEETSDKTAEEVSE